MSALRRLVALLAGAAVVLVALVGTAAPASAHPLGNFTINRYASVALSAEVARIHYVLDLAEIPAFQVRDELEADPDGFADDQVQEIVEGLRLEVDGQRLDLVPVDRRLTTQPGEGGLETVRLAVLLEAALPEGGGDEVLAGRFVDTNGGDRIGWREIVVEAEGDARIVESTVPSDDVSDALRSYPEDRLQSPLDVEEASFTFTPGSEVVAAQPLLDGAAGERRGDRFTRLLDRQAVTPLVVVGMLGVAALVGVGHALAPGHGKTVMAAYLIGTRGRPIDAVLLGVIVSAMHTASVLLLGVALYQVDRSFALDRIYPVLTLISGIGVLVVGVWLATTRARTLRAGVKAVAAPASHPGPSGGGDPSAHHDHDHHGRADVDVVAHGAPAASGTAAAGTATLASAVHVHDHGPAAPVHERGGRDQDHTHGGHDHDHGGDGHDHDHGGHDHDHGGHDHDHGGHDHGHHHGPGGHSHELPEGVAPLSKRGLLLLATAGGVVPSPSAVIVLVSAFTLGRVGLGLALVAAFSVGLAATLTAVGLALVLGSRALGDRVSTRFVRVFPLLGAVALLVLGLVLTVQGLTGL